jgi:thymidylate kinase
MFTVAFIGPDGAGKTTVAHEVKQRLGHPAAYMYMGVNWEASDQLLWSTRLMQRLRRRGVGTHGYSGPRSGVVDEAPPPFPRRMLAASWSGLALANRLAEEWHRQYLAWLCVRRGVIVIFDRHFFPDYFADDIAAPNRSLGRRLHGFLLDRVYPKPDVLLYLDAPPELLHARKGEGTLESLEQRRQDYLGLARYVRHFVIIDASQPLDQVVSDATQAIEAFVTKKAVSSQADSSVTNGSA